VSVLRKYQIKWIAEQFLRESLKEHDKERNYFTTKPSWFQFINNITVDAPGQVGDHLLTEAVKDAVVEFVRREYRERTGRDPDGAA